MENSLTLIESYSQELVEMDSRLAEIKAQSDALTQEKKTIESKRVEMEKQVVDYMEAHNSKSLKAGNFTITAKKNPPALVILDEKAIPEQFFKTKTVTEIDKTALKDHVKELPNGEWVNDSFDVIARVVSGTKLTITPVV